VTTGTTVKPFGPVTGVTVPNILSWTLGYNPDDDITGLTDNLVGSNSQTLGYDNLNRLNTGSGAYGSLSYGYDANGNRNTETLNGTNTTFNIASSSNQLVSLSGGININYSYDANGNMTGDGTNTYTYGNTNRLASVTTGSGPDTYQYNALGQRVEKTVGGVTTLFVYDEVGHLLGEYTPAGTLVAEHIWLNNRPIGVITPSGLYYVQTDQLDTPRDITNASKKVVWQWRADPFGNGAPTGSLTYNLRFPGQYYDAETGHNYNYFRDYDPTTGRYIESDPMGLHSSLNTYAYASGNPVSMYDPLGLCKIILRFKPIPWIGQKFHIYHSYILTIQPNGSADFYRGGPVGVPNWESAWGNITTKYGSYGQNTPDWDPTNPPQEVIYSDDKPCNCFNKDLGDIIEKINASDTPYKPLGDNSNSVAGTALRDLGFKIGTPPVLVPGFDYQITIPGH